MRISFLVIVFAFITMQSLAQPVLTPRNMALGGGGSTYITNYNANFYNPANLMIQDRKGDFEIGFLIGGVHFNGIQNFNNVKTQYDNAKQYFQKYNAGSYAISEAEQDEIVDENYNRNSTISGNNSRYETTLLGMKWKKKNQAFSIAVRSRTASDFATGLGWYSTAPKPVNDLQVLDRTLIHRYQTLHEISLGYAETFRFLTNLSSRLDNFIIGIAPKIVFGGAYQNAVWENKFYEYPGTDLKTHIQSFYFAGTGQFGSLTTDYLNNIALENAIPINMDNNMTSVNGVGAGLDIGVTYLLTFGNDLSAVRPGKQPTRKSLRLSFSMTDIGFVSYSNKLESLQIHPDTAFTSTLPQTSANQAFVGARGQYHAFIEQFAENNPFLSAERNNSNFSVLLPMAIHGGAMLELNRLKLMGDVSVGLTDNAFNSTTLISSVGIEIRPFMFLPLRAGTQFEAQHPRFLSLGTAIETKNWDFSVAAQFTPKSLVSEVQLTGISVATLQFHF